MAAHPQYCHKYVSLRDLLKHEKPLISPKLASHPPPPLAFDMSDNFDSIKDLHSLGLKKETIPKNKIDEVTQQFKDEVKKVLSAFVSGKLKLILQGLMSDLLRKFDGHINIHISIDGTKEVVATENKNETQEVSSSSGYQASISSTSGCHYIYESP